MTNCGLVAPCCASAPVVTLSLLYGQYMNLT